MKLGFFTAILPEVGLREIAGFAAEHGFECLEVACWPREKAERKYAGVTHIEVASLTPRKARDIRGILKETGVVISALGYYPNLLSLDSVHAKACEEHLKRVIDAAAMLEIGRVNTFIGAEHTLPLEANFARFLETWPPIVRYAVERSVRVGIENCPMLFSADEWPSGKNLAYAPAIWRRMFEAIPSPNFGLNYDPSHLVWMRMDYLRPLREFAARLFHVHAKDARVDLERLAETGILAAPLQFHQPRVPGFGDIDWGRFMAALTACGYDGPVCIEVEDDTFGKTLPGRQRALLTAANVLRPYFPKLRGTSSARE